MKAERWGQINKLFQAALALDPDDRVAFLDHACKDDDALRTEVESLIAAHDRAGSFISAPAVEVAAPILADNTDSILHRPIGPYRIVSQIGAGGMGEVYLAQDTRLGRKVALKLLPDYFTRDPQRVGRFQQEARAASALNHPNIITIHEIGQVESRHYMATEFIEGATLRQSLASDRMSLSETLEVAIQIASALAAAHQAGIVHRDIKPENVMVRPDGIVKVLDFGLAKLMEQPQITTGSQAPTAVKVDTDPGTVMGTVSYMSPEQVRGQAVDMRTDIFSFGVVLYEMLTGRAPFAGESSSDVIAAILKSEPPPLSQSVSAAPAELQRIISKTLRKDPNDRYQTIKDLLVDIKTLKQELEFKAKLEPSTSPDISGATVTTGGDQAAVETAKGLDTRGSDARTTSSAAIILSEIKRHKKGAALILAIFVIALSGIAFALYKLINQNQPQPAFQTIKITSLTSGGKAGEAAISPDGKYVVHAQEDNGKQSLWMRQVAINSSVQIVPPADGQYTGLTFSPDGIYLYYVWRERTKQLSRLYQIPVLGGAAKPLIEQVDGPVAVSPDGTRLAFVRHYPVQEESTLIVANADGTSEGKISTRDFTEGFGVGPAWSPDGKKIAVTILATPGDRYKRKEATLIEVPAEGGAEKPITSQKWWNCNRVAWLADGSGLIILAAEHQGRQFFQPWFISYPDGEARRIVNDLNGYTGVSLTTNPAALVTVQIDDNVNVWVAPDGDAGRAKKITSGKSDGGLGVSWTPDGKIVCGSNLRAGTTAGTIDIVIMEADGGNQKQLTAETIGNFRPSVSPDGRYILFTSGRAGNWHIYRINLDGSNPKELTHGRLEDNAQCSPDGQWVLYTSIQTASQAYEPTVSKVPIDGGESVKLIDKFSASPAVSPDGKFVACYFKTVDTIPWRIAVFPFAGGQPVRVFDSVTFNAPLTTQLRPLRWSSDSRAVLYLDTRDGVSNIWSQPIDGGAPKPLTNFTSDQIFWFDYSRDGKRLACSRGNINRDVVLISSFK